MASALARSASSRALALRRRLGKTGPAFYIMNWNNYLIKTKASAPRPLLVEALNYVKNFKKALDLGCGAMNDTKTIFKAGFVSIDAVDNNPSVSEIAKDIVDTGFSLKFYEETFSKFLFVHNNYDLISAQYSLPFTKQTDF